MKKIIFSLVIFLIFIQGVFSCDCTMKNCNPTDCTCYATLDRGFWKAPGNNCTECVEGYSLPTDCKSCNLVNFDPSRACKSCMPDFFGPTCSTVCNSTTCAPSGGNCTDTGVCQCFRSNSNGFWDGEGCRKCWNQYDVNTECKQCRGNWQGTECNVCKSNFDPATDCQKCKPGYYGPDCLETCDAQEKCFGNGFCAGANCMCYDDVNRGHWDESTNCKTCKKGWTGEKCVSPICTPHIDGICNKRGKCVAPEVCDCSPFYHGEVCQNNMCFGFPGNESQVVCSGKGVCLEFDDCYCYWGYRGRDCSESYIASGWGIGLQVIIGIAVFSVFAVFLIIIIVFRRKVENPKHEPINWVELQESDDDNVNGLAE